VKEHNPDVLYTSGWFHEPYRQLIASRDFDSTPKWIGVDTPWLGNLRQHMARLALRGLVKRVARVFVAGERAWQYLRMLGAPESKLRRGLYGVDYEKLAPAWDERNQQPGGWPRRFLFIGRYHADKGIATLVEGYAKYREKVGDAWPLSCCGTGELESMLSNRPGIENLVVRQPAEIIDIFSRHGAFVLASQFDPWPLVVVESSAAGLPVICTEACGSAVELVRPYHSGITVASGDAGELASAMRWMHEHHEELPKMGRRGRELASAYSAQAWARRWLEAAQGDAGRDLP